MTPESQLYETLAKTASVFEANLTALSANELAEILRHEGVAKTAGFKALVPTPSAPKPVMKDAVRAVRSEVGKLHKAASVEETLSQADSWGRELAHADFEKGAALPAALMAVGKMALPHVGAAVAGQVLKGAGRVLKGPRTGGGAPAGGWASPTQGLYNAKTAAADLEKQALLQGLQKAWGAAQPILAKARPYVQRGIEALGKSTPGQRAAWGAAAGAGLGVAKHMIAPKRDAYGQPQGSVLGAALKGGAVGGLSGLAAQPFVEGALKNQRIRQAVYPNQ